MPRSLRDGPLFVCGSLDDTHNVNSETDLLSAGETGDILLEVDFDVGRTIPGYIALRHYLQLRQNPPACAPTGRALSFPGR